MPVEQVSWNDCQAFVERLNARIPGGGFRLPTEAEWEYACRAGTDSTLARPQELEKVAWYQDTSRLDQNLTEPSFSADDFAPRPVGTKQPNRLGIHDMLGNVWEWCADLYRPYLGEVRSSVADAGVETGTSQTQRLPAGLRILRGGAYADPPSLISPAFRYADRPTHAFRWVGLRLARSVPASE
jgi:formylglycine-generating enzyme required for sulfatase activity